MRPRYCFLSQNYARYPGVVFPLFAALPDLSFQNFTTFFEACRNVELLEEPLAEPGSGRVSSPYYSFWFCSLRTAPWKDPAAVVTTFAATLRERFAKAREAFDFAKASLESLQRVLESF